MTCKNRQHLWVTGFGNQPCALWNERHRIQGQWFQLQKTQAQALGQPRAAQHSPTSSHQSKAVQPWSSWTFLPLYKEDMGVKSVVTALTSYRIHGFSIAWRIWTLRRWKPTSGTASKVHVWSTRTGSSQTPAWVKHSTYMPNTTGFIVRRELRKQSCFVSTTKQQEHLLGEASRYTHA